MTAITFDNKQFSLNEDETLLDGLLRSGEEIAYGCKAGACQSCLVKVDDGEIPTNCQTGLSENQKALNYVLSCQCKPQSPLTASKLDTNKLAIAGTVIEKNMLNNKILRLKITADINFQAGQYITLWKDEKIGRSYSIASTPEDGYLECHIKVHENGAFSRWAAEELQIGDELKVQGPMGLCFYSAKAEQPLLLAAISTGLAPIMGILKKALSSEHQGEINLMLGAKHSDDLYLVDELQGLADSNQQIKLHFLTQEGESQHSQVADIYQYCQQEFTSLKDHKVYLCGADSFVKKMRKTCFLNGASMSDIVADSFVAFQQ